MAVYDDGRREPGPGPFVRPYAITRGRTEPDAGSFIGLIDLVVAVSPLPPAAASLGPEHREILLRCQHHIAVADLAADIKLPTGVVRVLLSDLREGGFIRVYAPQAQPAANQRLLQEVLDGLNSL